MKNRDLLIAGFIIALILLYVNRQKVKALMAPPKPFRQDSLRGDFDL